MSPLLQVMTLGALLEEGHLRVVEKQNVYSASWEPRRARGCYLGLARGTSPDAAIEGLADQLLERAEMEWRRLDGRGAAERELSEAIRLTIGEIRGDNHELCEGRR